MPLTNDIRKTLANPSPLYFAAGVIDKIREEAPSRIAAVRETDPKEVQAKFTDRAKETQSKVTEALGTLDTDIKKLREQAQTLALHSVGVAAEYAVKAREAYDELAERGRGAVQTWRGEEDDTPQVTVEREPVRVAEPPKSQTGAKNGAGKSGAARTATKSEQPKTEQKSTAKSAPKTEAKGEAGSEAKAKPAAKKTTTRKSTTTRGTTTPKSGS